MTIEQQAEDILRAMVSESWNESVDRIAELLREIAELKARRQAQTYRAMVFADIAWETKYEATRRVADAAVAYQIASDAESKVTRLPRPDWRDSEAKEVWIHACDILINAEENALLAMGCAVREYRALTEKEEAE